MVFPILGSGALPSGEYEVTNGVRTEVIGRTRLVSPAMSNATQPRRFTLSFWFKPDTHLTSSTQDSRAGQIIFGSLNASDDGVGYLVYSSGSDKEFQFFDDHTAGNPDPNINWRPYFQDHSAWYHIVLSCNSQESTDTNRVKFYVNSFQEPLVDSATYPGLNQVWTFNSHYGSADYQQILFDGTPGNNAWYEDQAASSSFCEMAFIDGQALAPTDFAETDSDSGIWKPKDFKSDVTFGTNGWYLEFKESGVGGGSSSTIGADTSGNDRHFSSANINDGSGVTGYANFPLQDTCTNNFCTLNAANAHLSEGSLTLGNLVWKNTLNSSPHHGLAQGTMAVTAGKWYWEVRVDAVGGTAMGIGAEEISAFGKNNVAGNQGVSLFNHGYTHQRGSDVAVSGSVTYTTNDIIGVVLDMDNRKIYFHKNGTYFNSGDPTSGATGTGAVSLNALDVTMTPAVSNYNSGICNVNFGNPIFTISSANADGNGYGRFEYAVPSGYYALCTKNLAEFDPPAIDDPSAHFQTTLYTGNATNRTITHSGNSTMQPDFIWVKRRDSTSLHNLTDSTRGTNKVVFSDSDIVEETTTSYVTAINANGFDIYGNESNINADEGTFIAWTWKANGGTTTAGGGDDTAGTSTYQANTTAGFSIVTYTGTGSAMTVAHGLGKIPEYILIKKRTDDSESWRVFHQEGYKGGAYGQMQSGGRLDVTNAFDHGANSYWNNTPFTSTVFTVKDNSTVNDNTDTYVAYCFAGIQGYSKFGGYTGNGSADGPFNWLGFKPAYVLIKSTDQGRAWILHSNLTEDYNHPRMNPNETFLSPDAVSAEGDSGDYMINMLSNGFKLTSTSSQTGTQNTSGEDYIYMAFAENPFVTSTGIPSTAR